ncbi:MAG TPA: DUF6569 family protein [Candidatus Sulfopaludibacter sp.]|nr:DUF6569 family protein [Candidatus Sulfopaludibacter sp.]
MGIRDGLRRPWVKIPAGLLVVAAVVCGQVLFPRAEVAGAAGGPGENDSYRVLAPIESGNLLLFPVVRANGKSAPGAPFLTLDEGLKNGSVEVTEAGKVRGLVRHRGGDAGPWSEHFTGDQVNTLVLVNNSKQPLLLLAGEIVTGGKQDRVISKDRIVPPGSDPIDLSVFCIEPGRWVESSAMFSMSDKTPMAGFMVQPMVREQAMAAKNQQQVWASVHGSIAAVAAAPMPSGGPMRAAPPPETTSYAKAMQSDAFKEKVDEAAAPLMTSRDEIMAQLRKENAVGVVVAVRGEIVWADIFSSTDLLSRYWTKLVRSYAAESLTAGETHAAPTVADAQRFLEMPTGGTENSEGSVGIYRYFELKSGGTEEFVLESLLPDAKGEVHISKLKLRNAEMRSRHEGWVHPMPVQPIRPPLIPPVPVEPPQ